MYGVVLSMCSGFDTMVGVVLVPVSKPKPVMGVENDPKRCKRKKGTHSACLKWALKNELGK